MQIVDRGANPPGSLLQWSNTQRGNRVLSISTTLLGIACYGAKATTRVEGLVIEHRQALAFVSGFSECW